MGKQRHIGLFFGSFNPIHHGHLIIGTLCLDKLSLDAVWFVVSPHSPFKIETEMAADDIRSEMVAAAVKNHPGLALCDIELRLPKPSYTIQTIRELQQQFPADNFTMIIGEDNLSRLHEWKEIDLLLNMVKVVVYKRHGHLIKTHPVWEDKVTQLDLPVLDISSTMIRERVRMGKPITYFVHPSTELIILKNGLYK